MNKSTRRNFLKNTAAAGSFFVLPSGLLSNPPNSRLCSAHIGTGGRGRRDLPLLAADPRVQVIGLCDVDRERGDIDANLKKFPSATYFKDYREMLAKLGAKVDLATISTPDHTHYPATMAAMELGKHVYTQKPLTHKLAEARHLQQFAAEKNLTTQMGIQNQSREAYRLTRHYVQEGVLGKVSRVYVWSFKNWGYNGPTYTEKSAVPASLDWNLWLGTGPVRPYVKGVYHPGNWRKILDYGCGTLGDMGIHIFDTPFKSLGLTDPKWVEAECRAPNGFAHAEQGALRLRTDEIHDG